MGRGASSVGGYDDRRAPAQSPEYVLRILSIATACMSSRSTPRLAYPGVSEPAVEARGLEPLLAGRE